MTLGLVGKKCGMTRVFEADGNSIPVTVIAIEPNHVTQIKTLENDGYYAVQIATSAKKISRVTKPMKGHFAKAKVEPSRKIWEFRLKEMPEKVGDIELKLGVKLPLTLFKDDQMVDVIGTSKGKGFAGVVKRYNFKMQDATHGNSLSHRAPGSIGQNQSPGRVFKGKKMAGHLGDERVTIQNLKMVKVDKDRNLLLISGAVPGAKNGYVVIKPATKHALKGDK